MNWTTFSEFVQEWWLLLACIAVVAIVASYKYYKKKNKLKSQALSLQARATPKPEPERQEPRQDPPDVDPFDKFGSVQKKEEKKDVMLSIQQLNSAMNTNTDELDRHMTAEFERIQKKLEVVHARKEYIRKYGMELSRLYDKHQESEAYLSQMLQGMQSIVKKNPKREDRKQIR